jgi:hypothetical protein
MVTALVENFGLNPTMAFVVVLLLAFAGLVAVFWFVQSAPPRTLVLSSGPPGSSFQRWAGLYEKLLAKDGVRLQVLPSKGSLENLQRLESAASGVDIGFVQGGLAADTDLRDLVSLGSVAYQPLWVFYRGSARIGRLSELTGQRIAVGAVGSGTRSLALTLLKTNGITGLPTLFLDLDAEAAASGLLDGKLDAVFLMGDSASLQTLRSLVRSPDIHLYAFSQADAYTRRFAYLDRIELPEGSIDLGTDLPAQDVVLVGPTVELVARKGLHPALSDLLIQAAQEVHGKPGLLQKRGEFPAALEHEFPISDDALRFYKSGKGFLSRTVHNFWLVSLLNRILVVFVPMLLVLIPTLRFLPVVYRWRIQLRLYRCYRPLLLLERDAAGTLTREQRQDLLRRLDGIEETVNRLRVPASFADQFYGLRGHIAFVRERLTA